MKYFLIAFTTNEFKSTGMGDRISSKVISVDESDLYAGVPSLQLIKKKVLLFGSIGIDRVLGISEVYKEWDQTT